MPSQHIIDLCTSAETVTQLVAAAPNEEISKVANKLFKKPSIINKVKRTNETHDDFEDVIKCGKFPYRPSDLFLKIYKDVLSTLEHDPLAGLVSPSLLASSGVIPLSVVSVIPDIMRHYADLIVRAQSEVFIATNYWEPSHSAGLISDALKELSRRTSEKQGSGEKNKKIVVKLMYDRGTPSQFIQNHSVVKPQGWAEAHIPTPEEMPYVDLEVVNYHRPLLGTFHAKFLIVDRKIACLNSNNIQDRPNVEMMVHLEGPIIESFYDMALLTWSNAMNPPLPLLNHPHVYGPDYQYKFQDQNENLTYIDPEASKGAARDLLRKQHTVAEGKDEQGPDAPPAAQKLRNVARQATGGRTAEDAEVGNDALIGEHPHMEIPSRGAGNGNEEFSPAVDEKTLPTHNGDGNSTETNNQQSDVQNNTVEAGSTHESKGDPVASALDPGYDISDTKESDNVNSEITSEGKAQHSRAAGISKHLNAGAQDTVATASDDDSMDNFSPHIMHAPHKPCPIAMVNRQPRGTPGHEDPHKVPQDVAWLSGFKYAQQSIFIQTPTFNATPVITACLDACRRGVQVTLYLDLGFNDLGEMIPRQGGTNEEVVNKMYTALNAESKEKNLRVYWYTGKDQVKPLNASEKKRNCHVKFCSIDDQVAIVGNGNQDTQSWFHSMEINVMVDSKELVAEWIQGINANQNTKIYGLVDDKDGVWRDNDGNAVEASGTKPSGVKGFVKGVIGAVNRVRGTGGF